MIFFRCWVAGWGKAALDGDFRTTMHKVDVPIVPQGRETHGDGSLSSSYKTISSKWSICTQSGQSGPVNRQLTRRQLQVRQLPSDNSYFFEKRQLQSTTTPIGDNSKQLLKRQLQMVTSPKKTTPNDDNSKKDNSHIKLGWVS